MTEEEGAGMVARGVVHREDTFGCAFAGQMPPFASELCILCSRKLKLKTCLSQMGYSQLIDWSTNASRISAILCTRTSQPRRLSPDRSQLRRFVTNNITAQQFCSEKDQTSAKLPSQISRLRKRVFTKIITQQMCFHKVNISANLYSKRSHLRATRSAHHPQVRRSTSRATATAGSGRSEPALA